jgi:MFS family permease
VRSGFGRTPGPGSGHGTQRAALRNGELVRYVLTVLLNEITDWAIFIGVLVYAFDQGGSGPTGLAAIAMLIPSVLSAPIAGALAERHPPQRVRITGMVIQEAAFAVAAAAAFADLPTVVVVAPTMIGLGEATTLGPAGAVLRPAIVRSTRELTIASLWQGYADSISVLAGPLLATAMLLIGGAPAVVAACFVTALLALLVTVTARPSDPPGGGITTERVGALSLMRRNLTAVRARPGVTGVMVVAGGQFFVVGVLDIVVVVAAQRSLDLGESGPGLLSTMFGLGALLGGAVSTVLVRRRLLAPVIMWSLVVIALAATVLGAELSVVAALVLLPVIGLSRSVIDLLAQVLLQRSARPDALPSVFAVLELASGLGLIVGSVVGQVLIAVAGVDAALFGITGYFVLLLVLSRRSLGVADASADVPVVAMALLRRVPTFQPLPLPALETVARAAVESPVAPGGVVIREGERGDRFYVVADGRFQVTIGTETVATVERGGSFGEIALLADTPRMASVTALTPGSLLAIDRVPFLVAVTGHDSSQQAAWGAMRSMRGDDLPIDGPHQFARPASDDPDH